MRGSVILKLCITCVVRLYPVGERWWSYARKLPYYEEILHTNICTLTRAEMKKNAGN